MDMLSIGDRYSAAIEEHKHYDNASLAIATAIVIIPGAAFQICRGQNGYALVGLISFSALLTAVLFGLYRRMAGHASVARQVAAAIERGTLPPNQGISSVFADPGDFRPKFGYIHHLVAFVASTAIACLLAIAIINF